MRSKGFLSHVRCDSGLIESSPGLELQDPILFFVFSGEPLRFSVACLLIGFRCRLSFRVFELDIIVIFGDGFVGSKCYIIDEGWALTDMVCCLYHLCSVVPFSDLIHSRFMLLAYGLLGVCQG